MYLSINVLLLVCVCIIFFFCVCWEKHSNLSSFEFRGTKIIKSVLVDVWFYYCSLTPYMFSVRGRGEIVPNCFFRLVRQARHAGHCWRSKDELVSEVLLWTPTYSQAKAGRPARTYIQQLCEDTGCNPEDLPEAMNDREKWREMVMDIRAGGTTWWWWCFRLIYWPSG